jgi:hypothetical protein
MPSPNKEREMSNAILNAVEYVVNEANAAEDVGDERAYDLGRALAHSSPAEWFGTEWLHLEKADYDYMIRCVRLDCVKRSVRIYT